MSFFKFFIIGLVLMNNSLAIHNLNMDHILEKNNLEKITLNPLSYNQPALLERFDHFKNSFELSIKAFLNDFDEGNQTPLDIYYDMAALNFAEIKKQNKKKIAFDDFLKSEFKLFLNSHKTTLFLIQKKENNRTDFSLSHFWIFNLKIPHLTDFSFWCAISKAGTEPPLVFGMN